VITRNRVSRPEGFGIEVDGGDRNATMRNSVRDIGHDEISVGFDVVGNVVRRNHIRGAGEDGVQVVAKAKRTLLKRNHAFGAKDDGVDANHSTTKLTRSEGGATETSASRTCGGVLDGGGNIARHTEPAPVHEHRVTGQPREWMGPGGAGEQAECRHIWLHTGQGTSLNNQGI